MSEELPFEKNTPADIFRIINDQTVSARHGEQLIKRHGDRRALEAIIEYQKSMGVEIEKEIEERIFRIGNLIDEFFQKVIFLDADKHKKGKRKK
jgi:hypothetical protein